MDLDPKTIEVAAVLVDTLMDRAMRDARFVERPIIDAERQRMKNDPSIMQDALADALLRTKSQITSKG